MTDCEEQARFHIKEVAHSIIDQFGDGDMTFEEIRLLLTMNDIPGEIADEVAHDVRP